MEAEDAEVLIQHIKQFLITDFEAMDVISAADDVCVGGYGFKTDDSTPVCVCVYVCMWGGSACSEAKSNTPSHRTARWMLQV